MPHTLLLADDSVTIQRVIELTFADEDVQVIAVSDGDQAIERLRTSPPDIVLADIGMPGKNGYEVAQFMRQSPALAQVPVVLLTGAFEPVDQARAAEAGCDGVLAKPFEPQLVISRVKELLARRHGTAPPAEKPIAPPPVTAPPPPAAPQALDDYFDRLDAAFSSVNAPTPPPAAAPPAMTAAPDSEIDWFSSAAGAQGSMSEWDLPEPASTTTPLDPRQTFASPPPPIALEAPPPFESAAPFEPPVDFAEEPAFEAPAATSSVGVVQHTPSLSSPAQLPIIAALPPLADAFAALLAAEANGGAHAATLAWPATDLPAPAITEEQIEDIARRVLDRLSDRIVRETAAEIVSKVAEQLVRDEIERIKASINQQ